MARNKNTFVGGKMNKDINSRLMPAGEYKDALNIKVSESSESGSGVLKNSLSNKQITGLDLGVNPICIGMYTDAQTERVYWFVTSDDYDHVLEYDAILGATVIVMKELKSATSILNFDKDYLITGVNLIIDTDSNKRFLLWTDNLNPPRYINIDTLKSATFSTYSEAEVSLIKAPPLDAPLINLTNTETDKENNIERRFIRFAYRYRYADGEISALSPFSETAFKPGLFFYDYALASNESMINAYSNVNIAFNSGNSLVKEIDIVFKESGKSTIYLIKKFNKAKEGWSNDAFYNLKFNNNKVYSALPEDQLRRLYDSVPLKAQSQEMIGNRLIFGNYTEGFDIKDCDNNNIKVSFSAEKVSTAIVEGVPTSSLKSNRDYEIGIGYIDDFGRMTTVLDSDNNTVYVPNSDSINKNEIKVTISSKAPCFASKYRYFIKQSKTDYDVLAPVIFYEDDGGYVWIKLEGNEIDKINEGDFLYVKSDTERILSTTVQTRVLEIKTQPENFLDETATDLQQYAGTYFRIKPSGFRISPDDYKLYEFSSYDNSSNSYDNPIRGEVNAVEKAVYYGTGTLNDLTSGGTYTGLTDIRYIVVIDGTGAPDTFKWSDDNGATYTSGVAITGAAQALSNGVTVTFGATTGHNAGDEWIVSAKSASDDGFGGQESSKAYAIYKGIESNGNINIDDVIEGGAQIRIVYDEYNKGEEKVDNTFISTRRYDNLEEWFEKDGIELRNDAGDLIDESRIWFRRGTVGQTAGVAKYFTQDPTGDMCMIIISQFEQQSDLDRQVKVKSELSIFQAEQIILFETIPTNDNSEPYYEIGKTYDIDASGYHLGDVDQTAVVSGEVTLTPFNCFAWGNGFESYKIKDLFISPSMKIDTRPSETVEDYRQNVRVADLTYSKVYEQSTNFNGINEFNLSNVNFKSLDDKYGGIQKLHTRDTDLVVFQEDKINKVPYQKDIIYNADGSSNVAQSNAVLGREVAVTGEYGISSNPESFASYGNSLYFTDVKRGVVCRLAQNGITEISEKGMDDYFREDFRNNKRSKKVGVYDLYEGQYVLHVDDTDKTGTVQTSCGATITADTLSEPIQYQINFTPATGPLTLTWESTGLLDIRVTEGATNTDYLSLSGSGSIEYSQIDTSISSLIITLSPTGVSVADVLVKSDCPTDLLPAIEAVDETVQTITSNVPYVDTFNVLFNDTTPTLPVTMTIISAPSEGTALVTGANTIQYTSDAYAEVWPQDDACSLADLNAVGTWTTVGCNLSVANSDWAGDGGNYALKAEATATTAYLEKSVNVVSGQIYRFRMGIYMPVTLVGNEQIHFKNWTGFTTSPTSVYNTVYDNYVIYGFKVTANVTGVATIRIYLADSPTGVIGDTLYLDHTTAWSISAILDDSLTYQITDINGSDTAIVTIERNEPPAPQLSIPSGGEPVPPSVTTFNMSRFSYFGPNGSGACDVIYTSQIDRVRYHDGAGIYPTVGDKIYTDAAGLYLYDGFNEWWAIESGETILVNESGEVTDSWLCS